MPSRTEVEGTRISNTVQGKKDLQEVTLITGPIADNFALSLEMGPVIAIGATAARDVLMPADADSAKARLTIINISAVTTGVLTLKTSADAALVPAVALTQGVGVTLVHLGGTSRKGWRRAEGL